MSHSASSTKTTAKRVAIPAASLSFQSRATCRFRPLLKTAKAVGLTIPESRWRPPTRSFNEV
jgi:hypothetical protein